MQATSVPHCLARLQDVFEIAHPGYLPLARARAPQVDKRPGCRGMAWQGLTTMGVGFGRRPSCCEAPLWSAGRAKADRRPCQPAII